MVYIFESMLHMNDEKKLEQVRQQLINQIRDGVVLLPVNMRLKEVVDTPMGMDLVVEVETKKGGNCRKDYALFKEWLKSLVINGRHLTDEEIHDILFIADNGKMELELSAKMFLKKNANNGETSE